MEYGGVRGLGALMVGAAIGILANHIGLPMWQSSS